MTMTGDKIAKQMLSGGSTMIKRQRSAEVASIQKAVADIRSLPPTADENEKRARVKARKAMTASLHLN